MESALFLQHLLKLSLFVCLFVCFFASLTLTATYFKVSVHAIKNVIDLAECKDEQMKCVRSVEGYDKDASC